MFEYGVPSFIYSALRDFIKWVRGSQNKIQPEEVIRLRQKWKKEFEQHLRLKSDSSGYGDAIIRDVGRANEYPEVDEKKKGISSWFKVGLLGTYHRGLQVGLRIEGLKFDEAAGGWRYNDHKKDEPADVNAWLVGLIPFERIVSLDWRGDEYYNLPHIYCQFTSKTKEPYEEVIFCERQKLDQFFYYSEIAKWNSVDKLSKKLKTGYYAYNDETK